MQHGGEVLVVLIIFGTIGTIITVLSVLRFDFKKKQLASDQAIQLARLQNEKTHSIVPTRLQAYERLSLLCDRISISQLVSRLQTTGASAKDLHMAMLIAINQEFEHNGTQHIYVSKKLWDIIFLLRNNTTDIINFVAQQLPSGAAASQLSTALMQFMMQGEQGLLSDGNTKSTGLTQFSGAQSVDMTAKAKEAIREEAAMLIN
jgi:hypothetical protein